MLVAMSELVPANQLSALPFPAPPTGETYFEVKLQPSRPGSRRTVRAAVHPQGQRDAGDQRRPVAASDSTQDRDPSMPTGTSRFPTPSPRPPSPSPSSTVTSYGSDGSQESFALAPATIDFTTKGHGLRARPRQCQLRDRSHAPRPPRPPEG